jgi:hypothetical protein
MKHLTLFGTLALSVASVVVVSPLVVVGTVIDDFNDNTLDAKTWSAQIQGTGPSVSEVNGRLEISLPNISFDDPELGRFSAGYASACKLQGDFDVQVDYQLLAWPFANGVRVGLRTSLGNVERTSLGPAQDFPDQPRETYIAHFGDVLMFTATQDISGQLRQQRIGNVLHGFYRTTGGWIQIGEAQVSTEDVTFGVAAWSHDATFTDQSVAVAFDNVLLSGGTLRCLDDRTIPAKLLTVITHGRATDDPQAWMRPLADAIQARIDALGRSDHAFPEPFLFYWREQSNEDGNGWAEAAGDQLFGRIAQHLQGDKSAAIHLIGHSLGSVVIDQAAIRLLRDGYRVEQSTFLDAVNEFHCFEKHVVNQRPVAWQGIPWVEQYFGNGKVPWLQLLPKCNMNVANIEPEPHAYNHPEFENLNHTEIHEAYRRSVSGDYSDDGNAPWGWYFSPLGPGSDNPLPGADPLSGDTPTEPESVFNGSFGIGIDDPHSFSGRGNLPGYEWTDNSGSIEDGTSSFAIAGVAIEAIPNTTNYAARLYTRLPSSSFITPALKHAPSWISETASRFSFQLRFDNVRGKNDKIEVSFGNELVCESFATTTNFVTVTCDVTKWRSHYGVWELRLKAGAFNRFEPELSAWVDNFQLQ